MQISHVPSHLSFRGRLGYLFALAGFYGTLNSFLYKDLHPLPFGFVALSSLLLLVGIALVILDPYTKVAKWRLLINNDTLAKSGWGRVGWFLAFFGILLITMRFEALQSDPLDGITSPFWLLAIASLVVGTFLFLRD
jgi:uncharacterized membrane protein HdeD (DUF308 family)